MDTNLYFSPGGASRTKDDTRTRPLDIASAFLIARKVSETRLQGGPCYLYYANGFPAFVVRQFSVVSLPPLFLPSAAPARKISRTTRAYLSRCAVSTDSKFLVEYQNTFGERMNEVLTGFKHAGAFALDRARELRCHAFVFAVLPGGASPPRTRNGKIRAARYSDLMLRRDGAAPLHSGDPWIIPVAHAESRPGSPNRRNGQAPSLAPWDGGPWWRDPIRRPEVGPQYS